jgi:hypothetical protein
MVLQGVVGDLQLLLSLPLTPFTYHVVPARIVGGRVNNSAKTSKVLIVNLWFMIFLLLGLAIIQLATVPPRGNVFERFLIP